MALVLCITIHHLFNTIKNLEAEEIDGSAVKSTHSLAALPEDTGLIASTHWWLTIFFNSSSKRSKALFWPQGSDMQVVHKHTHEM